MKLSILAGVASVSLLAALGPVAACGSSSNNGGGNGGNGDGGGGEGSAGDGGGGEASTAKPYVGTVSAGLTIAGKTTTYTLSGVFVAASDAGAAGGDGGAPACLGTQSGSCCYLAPGALADAGTGAGDGGATVSLVSAGTILVKDGTTAVANMSPGTNNGYGIASTNNPSVTWHPGDVLAVSASGATVEAFSGNLQTVSDFAGVTPALSTTAVTVPIASNLAISWTAGNGTNVHVLIQAFKGTAGDGSITCTVADSAAAVSVPSALLGKLTTGDNG
ncbi:MAG: hypothetical protein ACRELB_07910, partial [Polyangiaceae bacterium]